MKVSVVLLNYGTADLSIRAAESVLPEVAAHGGLLVIVDNASRDDSGERLQAWCAARPAAPVSLVRSARNTGYAGGMNLGIRATESEFVVLLNSDTVVRPGALAQMLAAFDAEDIGIVAPRLSTAEGARVINRFRFRTPLSEFVYASGTDAVFRMLRAHVIAIRDDEPDSEIGWLGFPCVMLRRAMIDAIGLLDERYFMYFEDSAYCRRARRAGWRYAYAPQAEVVHLCGKSSQLEDDAAAFRRLPAYYYDSRARYFIESYGFSGLVAANLLWCAGRFVSHARLLALKPPTKVAAGAGRDIWRLPIKDAQAAFGGGVR